MGENCFPYLNAAQLILIHRTNHISGKNLDTIQKLHGIIATVNLFDHKTISVFLQTAGIIVKVITNLDNSALFLRRTVCHLIRETILSHIERERQLFYKGIKVLSLFFIDEVANYREYDAAGQPVNGKYAAMFEEEYEDVISSMQLVIGEDEYIKYLQSISAARTHAGYFSVDGKGKMINSKVSRKETTSDDDSTGTVSDSFGHFCLKIFGKRVIALAGNDG